MQNRYTPYWLVVGGNVKGHIYDRERCSDKIQSVIPHFLESGGGTGSGQMCCEK